MALKTLEICKECKNKCKLQTEETLQENLQLLSCPKGNKFTRKKKKKSTKK